MNAARPSGCTEAGKPQKKELAESVPGYALAKRPEGTLRESVFSCPGFCLFAISDFPLI